MESDTILLVCKGIYIFIFTLFVSESNAIFKAVVLAVLSTATFYSYAHNRPYNMPTIQQIVEQFALVFSWVNWILVLTIALQDTKFTGALQMLFLGVPIICAIVYTRHEPRLRILMTSEKVLESAEICRKKNFYYFYIIDTREMLRESGIILKGYVNHHTVVCPYDTCPIKAFKRLMMKEKLSGMLDRKKWSSSGSDSRSMHADNNTLLLAQAKALYNNGMRKFTKQHLLRIDYANFLLSRMKDRKAALKELDTLN